MSKSTFNPAHRHVCVEWVDSASRGRWHTVYDIRHNRHSKSLHTQDKTVTWKAIR